MTIAIKLLLAVGAIGLWWLSQKLIGAKAADPRGRIGDLVHEWTEPWYLVLKRSPRLADSLLISSSLVIDALGLFLILSAIFGGTIRPLLGLLMLFTLRQVNQLVTTLPPPEGMIWRNPGFPSIFVTYGVTNDLFFSGHTALAVLGAMELSHVLGGGWPALVLGGAIVGFEVGVVLLLRAHWTMDVFAGIVTAILTGEVAFRLSPAVDQWLQSLGG